MPSNWPGREVAAGSLLYTKLTSCKLPFGKRILSNTSGLLFTMVSFLVLEMLSVAFLFQQEARWWLVPAVLQRSGLGLSRHHIRQHDCGQYHNAGNRWWHFRESRECLEMFFFWFYLFYLTPFVWFSSCPNHSSLMWWSCPICTGMWWATCAQGWWEDLASCLGPIMVVPMLSLKRWVLEDWIGL